MKPKVKCKLHTKASEELKVAVAKEINVKDKPIEELLNDKESSDDNRDSGEGDSGS